MCCTQVVKSATTNRLDYLNAIATVGVGSARFKLPAKLTLLRTDRSTTLDVLQKGWDVRGALGLLGWRLEERKKRNNWTLLVSKKEVQY
jgi:hypothetical protein